jgi:ketosteroid isomerase-like protein
VKKISTNRQIVLDILRDEARGNVASALHKMSRDYTMTWVYQSGKDLFPSIAPDFKTELREAYATEGREYDIRNIAEGEGVVMVELIESYPNPKTKKVHRTPLVLVLEMKKGKIQKGRHYCDPSLSHLYLNKGEINKAYKGTKTNRIIK